MKKMVRCPTCGAPTSFEKSNSFRPFCSERCQILDLGAWADEKYVVPENAGDESESSSVNEKQNDADDDEREPHHSPPKDLLN